MKGPSVDIEADVVVIGGGPIGSYSAARLAEKGSEVVIFEEDHTIGRPQQCAGLVNARMFDLPLLEDIKDNIILNEIMGADIISPNGNILNLRGEETKAYSIDRARFDHEMFKTAVKNGAGPFMDQKVTQIEKRGQNDLLVRSRGIEGDLEVRTRSIIGCEGISSIARRSSDLKDPGHVIPGLSMEMVIKDGDIPTDLVSVITGQDIAKGFFSWAVPAGKRGKIRIGLAAVDGDALRKGASLLLRDKRLKDWIGKGSEISGELTHNYGSVPMGSPGELSKDGILILGDSAGMAKPTSGGGIFPGLKAVDSLMLNLKGSVFLDEKTLKGFKDSWRRGYGKELDRSRVFRSIISKITDDEIEMVIEKLNNPDLLEIINKKGDIDHPIRLALSLLKKDPSLLKLIPRFLPHMRRLA